ncbi:ParB family chromosome partitioning protein [Aquimarina sp. MAR_2010_214]|uniref:ParB/RepB/Spo0J family partition protein n=1 Tax=Aquimarina sp. MAR_2010_214 TaxID=1250026 RepID=UPI000C707DF7|nr:ParB/RepB/Spo0J family partition protein [Aquimarina sp. MAR_2010_214]PKV50860.1 ParB family chromosome partitioning protein [Aquimarina sp. MAR_2010_214]
MPLNPHFSTSLLGVSTMATQQKEQIIQLSEITNNESNPRKSFDQEKIEQLAQSINQIGLLQNLIVTKNDEGYTVVAGGRRYRALNHLLELGKIDGNYQVRVLIIENKSANDNLEIALVENIQREQMHPLDEADVFFTLTKQGVNLEEVAAQSSVSIQLIKRRLLLTNLGDESKALYREGKINLSQAEALAMGNSEDQNAIVSRIKDDWKMDANRIREFLINDKPSVSMALFDKEEYTGGITTDLFEADDNTYFDDVEQFLQLQDKAVDQLMQDYENDPVVDWVGIERGDNFEHWRYEDAEEGENGGVIIHYRMDGKVEIHKELVIRENTKKITDSTPKERSEFSKKAYGYFANHKTILVQNEIATNPRKALEIDIIQRLKNNENVKVKFHKALSLHDPITEENRALVHLLEHIESYLTPLELQFKNSWESYSNLDYTALYEALKALNDFELNHVFSLLVAMSFGQETFEKEESENSIFHQVARDLDIDVREGWTPDESYFTLFKKDQLLQIADDCGASIGQRLHNLKRKALIAVLVDYYANPEALQNEDQEQLKHAYCPKLMQFEHQAEA